MPNWIHIVQMLKVTCKVWHATSKDHTYVPTYVHNNIQHSTDMKRWRCTLSHGAHITGDCSSFCAMKHQKSRVTPLWTGCQSIAGGDPQLYVAGTHLHTWVKRDIVEQSFLPKETKRWQGSNPDLWIQVQPVHLLVTTGAPWRDDGIIGAD